MTSIKDIGKLVFDNKYLNYQFEFTEDIVYSLNIKINYLFNNNRNIFSLSSDNGLISCKQGVLYLDEKEDKYAFFQLQDKNICSVEGYTLRVKNNKLEAIFDNSKQEKYIEFQPVDTDIYNLTKYGITKLALKIDDLKNAKEDLLTKADPVLRNIFKKYKCTSFDIKKIENKSQKWKKDDEIPFLDRTSTEEINDKLQVKTIQLFCCLDDLDEKSGSPYIIPGSHYNNTIVPYDHRYHYSNNHYIDKFCGFNIKHLKLKRGEILLYIGSLSYSEGINLGSLEKRIIRATFTKDE